MYHYLPPLAYPWSRRQPTNQANVPSSEPRAHSAPPTPQVATPTVTSVLLGLMNPTLSWDALELPTASTRIVTLDDQQRPIIFASFPATTCRTEVQIPQIEEEDDSWGNWQPRGLRSRARDRTAHSAPPSSLPPPEPACLQEARQLDQ